MLSALPLSRSRSRHPPGRGIPCACAARSSTLTANARTGEGHYPWDLRPGSTMTNANVEQTVTGVDGQVLSVKYKDGEKKLIVPPDATIVTYMPGDKSELKPGTKIFVAFAKKLPDGTLEAPRVNYGRDGVAPPM